MVSSTRSSTEARLSTKARYPFLPEAKIEYLSLGFDLDSFKSPSTKPIVERAFKRVINALKYGENVDPSDVAEDDKTEIASFPLAIIIVAKTGDKFLQRRFALAEASIIQKRMNELMIRDESEVISGEVKRWSEFIQEIARNVFMMDVEKVEYPPYAYTVGLVDYLKSASNINDQAWKLVNRVVDKGRVYLEARELVRLLRDRIERYILENIEKAEREIGKLPENLEEIVNNVKSQIPIRKIEDLAVAAISRPDAWPPCIRSIYSKLTSGESVSHFANFLVASFLINTGVSVDEVVSIYSQRSDFDEKIARYQVEHIAGLKGSRTRYTTPSCGKIKTNGLCIENGRFCGNIKNPMTYYKRKLRELEKVDKSKDADSDKHGEASS
ncbi:MAG: DNA primase large subunit PriL [Aigarchaeota archaeon]|nr:DNA primase large subunit PriL [Aigarchaeota archaeon]MCX8193165.1 DNA primase large subunit PriL [Nitrososphaeria archaeon]MDW7986306.1 DNA primase large subunit PriL [Nitrososphaerota archaeon]